MSTCTRGPRVGVPRTLEFGLDTSERFDTWDRVRTQTGFSVTEKDETYSHNVPDCVRTTVTVYPSVTVSREKRTITQGWSYGTESSLGWVRSFRLKSLRRGTFPQVNPHRESERCSVGGGG